MFWLDIVYRIEDRFKLGLIIAKHFFSFFNGDVTTPDERLDGPLEVTRIVARKHHVGRIHERGMRSGPTRRA